jgi:hypothetical protein
MMDPPIKQDISKYLSASARPMVMIVKLAYRRYLIEIKYWKYEVFTDGKGGVIVELTAINHGRKAIWKCDGENNITLHTQILDSWAGLPKRYKRNCSTYHWVHRLMHCAQLVTIYATKLK